MARFVAMYAAVIVAAAAVGHGATAAGQSLYNGAPPAFAYGGGKAVPVDMREASIRYVFDVGERRATGHARVKFAASEAGFPMLDLVATPSEVKLDGAVVPSADFALISDPDRATRFRVLGRRIGAGGEHVLELRYALPSDLVDFSSAAVRVGFFMSDLASGGREFFEQYGPASFEFDQVRYHFDVEVVGTQTPHRIFTNGNLRPAGANKWTVDFPDYFTTSSIYFHLVEDGRFESETYIFDGAQRDVPVTVYAASAYSVDAAVTESRRVLSELEETYGAFAHERAVIYVTPSGGGMEHCGATMTSMRALGHELTHSWFARGVMPANGNAGWIDEAIASWRDNGYPRAASGPSGRAANLGGFSAYRRDTTMDAYSLGATLISQLDYLFAGDGGMRAVLRGLFQAKKRKPITVYDFKAFLEQTTGEDLTAVFNRYVFGRSAKEGQGGPIPSQHPRPYTKDELKLYR